MGKIWERETRGVGKAVTMAEKEKGQRKRERLQLREKE